MKKKHDPIVVKNKPRHVLHNQKDAYRPRGDRSKSAKTKSKLKTTSTYAMVEKNETQQVTMNVKPHNSIEGSGFIFLLVLCFCHALYRPAT